MSNTRAWYITLIASFVLLALALALGAAGGQDARAADGIVYVDADAIGLGNGTSWTDAFTSLQPALDVAQPGDEIWVAAGIYTPTEEFSPGDPRTATFQLKNGVGLYGGFDPSVGATGWDHRDWALHETILSGDLNGDDAPPFGNNGENSYHVFYHPSELALDSSAILDGFTVTGGNSDSDSGPNGAGGGMHNVDSSPTVANCTFRGNSADMQGGGMYNDNSSPSLTSCAFTSNSAAHYGGGMDNSSSSPTLTDCTFTSNSAGGYGGGMRNDSSSPALANCTFSGNSGGSYGGGMFNEYSSPTLTDCTFTSNLAGGYGGGMYNATSSLMLTGCTFAGNSVYVGGGGMRNDFSSLALVNCIFEGNSAGHDGGGMYNWDSSPALTNCAFSANSAEWGGGGGIYNHEYSSPALTNCILWGDTYPEIRNVSDSFPAVTYSDVQGGCDTIPANDCGTGNINADPLFVDPANGDFHLGPHSPCIDAGTNDAPYLPEHDFEGDDRILDGDGDGTAIADMGVDEKRVYFVDDDALGLGNGTSWDDAFLDLQPALDVAQPGDEIWVAAGTYTPTEEFSPGDPRTATFQLKNGVVLYGGFDPSVGATGWDHRDWALHETILSGDLNGDDEPGFGNNGENSYHVFYHPSELALDSTAILDGFTVTGGNASSASATHDNGGGMFNGGASPRVTNCTFRGNSADWQGGGIYNDGSSPAVTNCIFLGNRATWYGGGMHNWFSSPEVINCIFSGNSTFNGGGMFIAGSSPTVTNCTFSGNSASGSGGGMLSANSNPAVTNCIFWGDSPEEIYSADNGPVVTYSDIEGGYDGTGNIDADPLFADAANGDYHLGNSSPAVGAGLLDVAPPTDIEGNPRPDPPGSDPDMGGYESQWPRVRDIWHVATAGSDVTGDGSETNPFATIQYGIDVSIDGDTVLVHTGTYIENISFEGKNITVGSLFVITGDKGYIPQTVIDGNQNGSVVTFENGEGPAALLSGLTIANGYAHGTSWPYNDGGGICVVDAAPQLTHLNVIYNSAINEGGGVYLGQNQSSAEVARLSSSLISNNSAGSSGGGIRFSSDNGRVAVVESAVITGNQANRGAGVHIYHSGTLENCLIANNTSATSAGGVYVDWGSRGAFITNSTIVDNSAPSWGGLDYVVNGATVRNSIIYGNDNGNWNGGSYTYSCTSPLPAGVGNIDANPLFVNAGSGDYHLGTASPCIDAGDNSAPIPIFDFEGHPRVMDGNRDGIAVVDMGVDEVFGYRIYLPLVLRQLWPRPTPTPTPAPRPTATPRPRPTNTPTG